MLPVVSPSMQKTSEIAVIGGGLVGMAIAYGLARRGESVVVLDGADDALRAARGNFGLVWVQGKGASCPSYARWSLHSANRWQAFADELEARTGVSVGFERPGASTSPRRRRNWRPRPPSCSNSKPASLR